jgi:uncharacterized protein (DUF488 family)
MTDGTGATIWTIGHSTRPLAEFLALLAHHRLEAVADVRRFPVWWRCHRALIADVLRVRGFEVVHILDSEHATIHPYTSAARIVDGRLSYTPAEEVR